MNHHPDPALLEQHAAGTLPLGFALCVAVHLSFCAHCRAEVRSLQHLGGLLLEELQPAAVDQNMLETVLDKIGRLPLDESVREKGLTKPAGAAHEDIPAPLRHLVPNGYDALRWKTILPGLRIALLNIGGDEYQVALHRLRAGGKVPRHDHRGPELTLVLNGSFSDEYGVYGDGDFIRREPAQVHRPLAAQNEDCICLAVQTAPVRFRQHVWRVLNPFLS